MAFSKIILNGATQIDLTQDTTQADKTLQGYTGHQNDGTGFTGTYVPSTPTGTIEITENDTYDVSQYATAEVYVEPQLEYVNITENGTYNFSPLTIISVESGLETGTQTLSYKLVNFTDVTGIKLRVEAYTSNLTEVMNEEVTWNNQQIVLTETGLTVTLNGTSATVSVSRSDIAYFYVTDLAYGVAYANVNVPSGGGTYQSKTVSVTPTESTQTQTVSPDSGYDALSSVTVNTSAIDSEYVGSGIDRRSSTDLTVSGATVTAPAGYYSAAASKSVASGSATTPSTTITANPTISVNTTTGLITASTSASQSITPTVSAGYVSNGTAGTVSVSGSATEQLSVKSSTDLTVSGATVTAPAGFYPSNASKSVASGTVTAPASISGTSASVSTGTNTITLSKTVSVTPSVSTAGYVSAGTAGNSAVSLTASVTTKAAATITPGTTNQTIAAGTYLTGTQTIAGDADLVGSNILSTANIFGVQGTVTFQTYYTGSSAPSSSQGVNGDIYLQT